MLEDATEYNELISELETPEAYYKQAVEKKYLFAYSNLAGLSLTKLFADAFVISLPIMGTLLMITLCMGLLSKAAPQMNLLSEGFPIMILVGFVVILMSLPALINFFSKSFYQGFLMLEKLFISFSGGIR